MIYCIQFSLIERELALVWTIFLSSNSFLLFLYRKADLECSDHSGGILEFFDKDLEEPICAHCIITEKHKGHEIVPIGELVWSCFILFSSERTTLGLV